MKSKVFSFIFLFLTLCLNALTEARGQEESAKKAKRVNFGYSVNPSTKPSDTGSETAKRAENNPAFPEREETRGTASALTNTYKLGAGDVIAIRIENSPMNPSADFTVLGDGTVDYPLAGGFVKVGGLSTEEAEEMLEKLIKLYPDPDVSVYVREFASHKITVKGLAGILGEMTIRREALPLYVVQTAAIVSPEADSAVISRSGSADTVVDIKRPEDGEILLYPGDVVEFKKMRSPGVYFVVGAVTEMGQKPFVEGMTLYRSAVAAGAAAAARSALIRRRDSSGAMTASRYDLKAIKNGTVRDPAIRPGDIIDIQR